MTPERWERIQQLFQSTLERGPEERSPFLAEACGEDTLLRAEVESLIASHCEPWSLLDGPAVSGPERSFEDGQLVGDRYRILRFIARGGMGEVYEAEDGELRERVALKVVCAEMADSRASAERFRREVLLARKVTHPNVCRLFDIGVHRLPSRAGGVPFLTMELLRGVTLADELRRAGRMTEQEALPLVIQMAAALDAAHSLEIVHRDFKSANVMLVASAEGRRVVVTDFGLARSASSDKGPITATGRDFGTPDYMAPEQVEGRAVTAATDVYALGVVVYEMVTGERPFSADTPLATALKRLQGPPPSPRKRVPQLDRNWERVILRCLAPDPADRFSAARDVVAGLGGRWIPVGSRLRQSRLIPGAVGLLRRRRALPRRDTALAVGAAVLVVSGVVGWLWHRSSRERWALETATPEITRLVDGGEFAKAAALTGKARQVLPHDPTLERLWIRATGEASIESVPSGADVSIRPYREDGSAWQHLGKTPLKDVRLPKNDYVWRIAKAEYAPALAIGQAGGWGPVEWAVKLRPEGSVPAGMLAVTGGETRLLHPLGEAPRVDTGDYLIDRHEVTNEEYKAFVDAGGYQRREFWRQPFVKDRRALPWENAVALFRDLTGRPGPATWEAGSYPKGLNKHPVAGISWYEAAAYAEFAGKSLPTTYHWTYASQSRVGALWAPASNFHGAGTQPVGVSGTLSGYGTTDMAGNVKEWCWNEGRDGKRFIMGGGFGDPPYVFFQSDAQSPWDRKPNFGFRCVKLDAPPTGAAAARIEVTFRDYLQEKPVADAVFEAYRGLYAYDKSELQARVEETETTPNWTREKVSFDAAYGNERVTAHLFLPRSISPPFQAVMFFPPADAMFLEKFSFSLIEDDLGFVLKSGRVLIVPIYKSTFERQDGLRPGGKPPAFFRDNVIMMAKDVSRSLDYLQTRKDIDSTKLAYFGDSHGAQLAPVFLAIDDRFKAAILTHGGFQLRRDLPEVDRLNFAPRVATPILMLNGRYDDYFPLDSSQLPLFRLLGTAGKDKKHVVYEAGHGNFPRMEAVRESLDWLDKYLGPVRH
jgi:serine/threonine protein kinase/dienelactone hydrolase